MQRDTILSSEGVTVYRHSIVFVCVRQYEKKFFSCQYSILYLFSIIIQTIENFHNGGNILNINIHSRNLSSECTITFTMSYDYIQNYKSIYLTFINLCTIHMYRVMLT